MQTVERDMNGRSDRCLVQFTDVSSKGEICKLQLFYVHVRNEIVLAMSGWVREARWG